jgi:diguanylate cyclase (GGDEF)-like protein
MHRGVHLSALAPAALLALLAGLGLALPASGVQPGVTWLLAGAAGGALLGAAWTHLVVAGTARRLAGAARALLDQGPGGVGDPRRYGALAPVAAAVAEVGAALGAANEAATTDRLTQVANRPTLLASLFAEVERAARYARPLSVAFVDIDHFKAVNDTYGHDAGDEVLRVVAALFREHTRQTDLVARYGGEEFVIVFPETGIDDATAVAEKLRLLVVKQRIRTPSGEFGVTISIGIAGGQGQLLRVDQLLRDADAAMYSAKSLGRNQTFVFAEIDDDTARIPRAPISPQGRALAAEVGDVGRQAAEAALAAIVSPLPGYRGQPSSLIAAIAVRLARELDQPDREVERIRVAALLHDIGKVAVPAQILEKPGPLDPHEWQAVVQHPRLGQVIIEQVAAVRDAGSIILHHHERYSGHGYPFGLRGSDIPLGARIVAIADAYDAMVSDRPYRAARSHAEAIDELRRHARVQFDPELVELFVRLYAAAPPRPDPSLLLVPPAIQPRSERRARPQRRASTA